MKTNELGKSLIKKWEGLRLNAYQDIVGIWTIGFGSVFPKVTPGQVITLDEANDRFDIDLARFEQGISSMASVLLNSNQFSALVSLAYNVGLGGLKGKGLMNKLNSGDYKGAADSFPKYSNAGGKQDPGLYKRRLEEKALFLTPITSAVSEDFLDKIAQEDYEQACLSISPHWSDKDD